MGMSPAILRRVHALDVAGVRALLASLGPSWEHADDPVTFWTGKACLQRLRDLNAQP